MSRSPPIDNSKASSLPSFQASTCLMSTRDRVSTGLPLMASTTSESTADFPRGRRVRVCQDQSVGPAGTRIDVLEPAGHPSNGSHTASASESGSEYPVRRGAVDSNGGVSDVSRYSYQHLLQCKR